MSHDKDGLPIDSGTLGKVANKCNAYAKALYYREQEFEISPESTINNLIQLYSALGQPEAANGLLQYANNAFSIKINSLWYENLERWDEALKLYNRKLIDIQVNLDIEQRKDDKYTLSRELLKNKIGKLRCHHALNDWEAVLKQMI